MVVNVTMDGKVIIGKERMGGEKVIIKRGSYYRKKFEGEGKNLIIKHRLYTLVYSANNIFYYAYRKFLRP